MIDRKVFALNEGIIIAIDPGREKTGIALLTESSTLVERCIVETVDIDAVLRNYFQTKEHIEAIVCGNGTNHTYVFDIVRSIADYYKVAAALVEESHTTEEAKLRYWQVNPRTGWRKLVPIGMLYPPEPVDDITAWIIGERYIQGGLK